MKWVVRAEWIVYGRTSVRDGEVATEIDATRSIADLTADVWLVSADTSADAIIAIGEPWGVAPTHIYAYEPTIRGTEKCIIHIGTERAHYWKYKPQTQKKRTDALQEHARDLITNGGDVAELAPIMAKSTGCHIETAKRHLLKARQWMHDKSSPQRGGRRKGAGRPKTSSSD